MQGLIVAVFLHSMSSARPAKRLHVSFLWPLHLRLILLAWFMAFFLANVAANFPANLASRNKDEIKLSCKKRADGELGAAFRHGRVLRGFEHIDTYRLDSPRSWKGSQYFAASSVQQKRKAVTLPAVLRYPS